jgi:hypothetical protein
MGIILRLAGISALIALALFGRQRPALVGLLEGGQVLQSWEEHLIKALAVLTFSAAHIHRTRKRARWFDVSSFLMLSEEPGAARLPRSSRERQPRGRSGVATFGTPRLTTSRSFHDETCMVVADTTA